MVDKVWTKKAGQKIIEQLDQHFKNNIVLVRYWIIVNHYSPKHGYTFFFNIQRPHHFTRSIPIGTVGDCTFDELIVILNEIRTKYHFTFRYYNFAISEYQRLSREVSQ
ncbi:hypothetical protein [uncultured Limosilactobacillus sp.]|uniref:hypothetical protein n=1 Tax=uncultured Limosilactobacillus sp. TaxID=2837629 RepID=UPI0025F65CA6|nr:hypothetical protein [uncultured Limosilactobacillus sp.]